MTVLPWNNKKITFQPTHPPTYNVYHSPTVLPWNKTKMTVLPWNNKKMAYQPTHPPIMCAIVQLYFPGIKQK